MYKLNCRSFEWLVFVVFGQSVRLSRRLTQLYLHSDGSLASQPWPSVSVLWPAAPLVYSTVKYAKVGFCGSLLMFFASKKLLGRTETRTRDRMYLGRIRSVRDISRDDRARMATCSLRTPTDRLIEKIMGYHVPFPRVENRSTIHGNQHPIFTPLITNALMK